MKERKRLLPPLLFLFTFRTLSLCFSTVISSPVFFLRQQIWVSLKEKKRREEEKAISSEVPDARKRL